LQLLPQQLRRLRPTAFEGCLLDRLMLREPTRPLRAMALREQAVALHMVIEQAAHVQQPARTAGRDQRVVEIPVQRHPFLEALGTFRARARLDGGEAVEGQHHRLLPGLVAIFDGGEDGALLELQQQAGDIQKIRLGDRGHAVAAIGVHLDHADRGEVGERLAQRADADLIGGLQFGEAQPGAGGVAPVQDIGEQAVQHRLADQDRRGGGALRGCRGGHEVGALLGTP
jgi:hypothetical protein